jgi:hypothetical protein
MTGIRRAGVPFLATLVFQRASVSLSSLVSMLITSFVNKDERDELRPAWGRGMVTR